MNTTHHLIMDPDEVERRLQERLWAAHEENLPIPHPGETLWEDFIRPMATEKFFDLEGLARTLGTTSYLLMQLRFGLRPITPAFAQRLGAYYDTSAEFWTNLQRDHDTRVQRLFLTPRPWSQDNTQP